MKVDKEKLRASIEKVIGNGVVNGEEIDVTTSKVMDLIRELILAIEHET